MLLAISVLCKIQYKILRQTLFRLIVIQPLIKDKFLLVFMNELDEKNQIFTKNIF